jgi:phosphohistidine phosphatase
MEILIIRHGQAVDDAPGVGDAGRWLTAKGRKITRRVGRWLAKRRKRTPAAIWTSPLVRAVQTAEIVAAEIGHEGEIRAVAELSPGRDPGDLLRMLDTAGVDGAGPLALVGHEPGLSMLVTALLGDAGFGGFRKSGVLALTWESGAGCFRFALDPNEMKARKKMPARAEIPPSAPPPEGK